MKMKREKERKKVSKLGRWLVMPLETAGVSLGTKLY